jgi:DNA-binding Lrp family transcriptional regulator
MFNMDKKDLKIIETLLDNSDISVRQISSKTLLPITTVHHRIKRMKKEGIIRKFTIELDHKKMGKPVAAYILVKVDSSYLNKINKTQHDLARTLKSLKFVERSDIVTGTIDLILLIRVKDIDELDNIIIDKLRHIQGIESTQTLVILREN